MFQSELHAFGFKLPKTASVHTDGGYLVSPVCSCSYCIETSPFGPRRVRGRTAHHAGQDFDCRMGDPIRASSSGVVRFVGTQSGYGKRVEIVKSSLLRLAGGSGTFAADQDIETSYSHLSKFAVKVGDRVQAGQVIGYCGNSGRFRTRSGDGTHLHYEVRVGGMPQDPKRFYESSFQSPCPGRTGESDAPGVEV